MYNQKTVQASWTSEFEADQILNPFSHITQQKVNKKLLANFCTGQIHPIAHSIKMFKIDSYWIKYTVLSFASIRYTSSLSQGSIAPTHHRYLVFQKDRVETLPARTDTSGQPEATAFQQIVTATFQLQCPMLKIFAPKTCKPTLEVHVLGRDCAVI